MRQAGRPLWVQERPVCRPWTSPDRPFEFKTGEDARAPWLRAKSSRIGKILQHCSAEARRGSAEQPQPKTFLTADFTDWHGYNQHLFSCETIKISANILAACKPFPPV